jgi:hypothetical protein
MPAANVPTVRIVKTIAKGQRMETQHSRCSGWHLSRILGVMPRHVQTDYAPPDPAVHANKSAQMTLPKMSAFEGNADIGSCAANVYF